MLVTSHASLFVGWCSISTGSRGLGAAFGCLDGPISISDEHVVEMSWLLVRLVLLSILLVALAMAMNPPIRPFYFSLFRITRMDSDSRSALCLSTRLTR